MMSQTTVGEFFRQEKNRKEEEKFSSTPEEMTLSGWQLDIPKTLQHFNKKKPGFLAKFFDNLQKKVEKQLGRDPAYPSSFSYALGKLLHQKGYFEASQWVYEKELANPEISVKERYDIYQALGDAYHEGGDSLTAFDYYVKPKPESRSISFEIDFYRRNSEEPEIMEITPFYGQEFYKDKKDNQRNPTLKAARIQYARNPHAKVLVGPNFPFTKYLQSVQKFTDVLEQLLFESEKQKIRHSPQKKSLNKNAKLKDLYSYNLKEEWRKNQKQQRKPALILR